MKYKNSLVLGKMYPPHQGHLYLIDTAIENSENVHIMVCYNKSQNIPGELRSNTLKEIYRDRENVFIHLVDDGNLPQYEHECQSIDDFYSKWVPFVYKHIKELDVVFTSEDYGDDFSRYLGIEHYLVDRDRVKYPISGTKIRTNPLKSWDFIPNEIRSFFVKKIAIMGPESVGKSTLTENLANYFQTNYVEEWGRTVYERNGNFVTIDDFIPISIGRQNIEEIQIKHSNRLLFCDTEDIITYTLSKMYHPNEFNKVTEYFTDIINKPKYDLYILLKTDCDAIQDGTRSFLNKRDEHYNNIKSELLGIGANFIEIGGTWDDRFNKSIETIKSEFNI